MTRAEDRTTYPCDVGFEVEQGSRSDHEAAADYLNATVDLACLQHEFGIFGGPDGDFILQLLTRLDVPLVSTLHTVLRNPSAGQRRVLRRIADVSAVVVVMSQTARKFLVESYEINPASISVIPHGVPAQTFGDTAAAKAALGLSQRRSSSLLVCYPRTKASR